METFRVVLEGLHATAAKQEVTSTQPDQTAISASSLSADAITLSSQVADLSSGGEYSHPEVMENWNRKGTLDIVG
jgi:hypothetical protein